MTNIKNILSLTGAALLMLACATIAIPVVILIAAWAWLNGKDFDHRHLKAIAEHRWSESE